MTGVLIRRGNLDTRPKGDHVRSGEGGSHLQVEVGPPKKQPEDIVISTARF